MTTNTMPKAEQISFLPAGSITSVDVQTAIEQLAGQIGGAVGVYLPVFTSANSFQSISFNVVSVDATSSNKTVLTPQSPAEGDLLIVRKVDSSANVVIVSGPSFLLRMPGESVEFVYAGGNWVPTTVPKAQDIPVIDELDLFQGTNVEDILVELGQYNFRSYTQERYTATGGQTVFNLLNPYTANTNSLQVYMNGLRLSPSVDYNETGTSQITLTAPAVNGDSLLFNIGFTVNDGTPPNINFLDESQILTEGQTAITLSTAYVVGINTLSLYLNGVRLLKQTDFTETDSTTLTLTNPATAGDTAYIQIGQLVNGLNPTTSAEVQHLPTGGGSNTTVRDALNSQKDRIDAVEALDTIQDGRLTTLEGSAIYHRATKSAADTLAASLPDGATVITDEDEDATPAGVQTRRSVLSGALTAIASFLKTSMIAWKHGGTGAVWRTLYSRLMDLPVSVKDFGAKGDGVTDDTVAIQSAITYCIQNGKQLFVPAGTYIVKPATGSNINPGTASQIRLDFLTADGQGLTMFGEGRGKSIFKEADGETAIGGKFTRMFICLMSATTYRLGSFTFKDLTFDKNGVSNGLAPSSFAWEGAHVIAFSGNSGAPSLDCLTFERIEIRDKVGAGIVAGPSDVDMKSIVISDFLSHDFSGLDAGYYGQKGCIEIANDVENGVIENVNCLYSQIETTNSYSSSRIRRYKVSNSKIGSFEFTDSGVAANNTTGTFIDINGLYSPDKFLVRGVTVNCSNSRLKHTLEHFFINSRFTNCEWLLPYNSGTAVVTSWFSNTPAAWPALGLASTCTLVNCTFTIDAATVDPACTGYALRAVRLGTGEFSPRTTLIGCSFDPRLYGVLDGYNFGGHWVLSNCRLAGHTYAALVGAFGSIDASFEFNDCDFSQVTGQYLLTVSATAYTLKVNGTYKASKWKEAYTGSGLGGANQAYYVGKPKLMGSAAPTTGTWTLGSKVYNDTPTAGGIEGFVCVTQGTPGTWKTFGTIAA